MATDDSTRGIAAQWWEELLEFRTTHPPKRVTVDGVGWEYIASADGEEALLILSGGAMVGEAGFTRIPAFEVRYRVIAPSYASVSTATELLDGLAGVLDAEGVREAHVLGPSYGGIVAQGFVRRHRRTRTSWHRSSAPSSDGVTPGPESTRSAAPGTLPR